MSLERVIIYKGEKSQTGKAARERYPDLHIPDSNESFDDIERTIMERPVLAMLPFWNSHGGEIKESNVARLIFNNPVFLYDLWPSRIKFECLVRQGVDKENAKCVTSVRAAEPQCSNFLIALGATFEGFDSTRDAFEVFKNSNKFDAVFVPPGQYDREGLKIIEADASNKTNFTTFVLLGKLHPDEWDGKAGEYLRARCSPLLGRIYAIRMPILERSISEDQQELLVNLTKDVVDINDIPSVIFVFEEEVGMCGILLEYGKTCSVSIPASEEGIPTDISIRGDIGITKQFYREELTDFISKEFDGILQHDFVKHIGTKTCLYACPPLKIFTHGFNPEVVEPVVIRMIDKHFELFVNGATCSQQQEIFFRKHQQDYYDKGGRFIEFTQV